MTDYFGFGSMTDEDKKSFAVACVYCHKENLKAETLYQQKLEVEKKERYRKLEQYQCDERVRIEVEQREFEVRRTIELKKTEKKIKAYEQSRLKRDEKYVQRYNRDRTALELGRIMLAGQAIGKMIENKAS